LIRILVFLLAFGFAAPVAAQALDPHTGRAYVVRDLGGQIVERLQPSTEGYVRRDLAGRRLGRAVLSGGGALTFYDTSGQVIGTARRRDEPPAKLRLQTLAVIRSPTGQQLGIIAAR
jgi:hypothetical protein